MRSRYRHPLAWGFVCGILGGGLSASAQQPKVESGLPTFRACSGDISRAEQDAARGLFSAGRQAYEEGEYGRAIRYWRDAFDLDCGAVVMLRNLANAYERARNLRGAIVCLETYLERKPNADDAKTVRNRINNLRLELDAARGPEAPLAGSTAPPVASTPTPAASGAVGTTIPSEPRGPGAWPWVVTGVGGAALAAGVYFYVDGSARVSDARDACGGNNTTCDKEEDADRGNRGRTFQGVGIASMSVGGAAVIGGLSWYFLATRKRPAATSGSGLWVVPALGPDYGGVGAVGRFLRAGGRAASARWATLYASGVWGASSGRFNARA